MGSYNQLGIYLRQDRATLVCISSQGRDRKLLHCFDVTIEEEQEDRVQSLAEAIARSCSERGVKFGQAAVALDCAMFMQHAVHSEFSDHKRIAATVRFDTEETLATDVADVAVAFRVISSDENGSSLDVFTVPRDVLSDILIALQGVGIDPVTVGPDVFCLSRFLSVCGTSAASSGDKALHALLSDSRGYLFAVPEPPEPSTMRAFPITAAQKREQLLAREILVTMALAEAAGQMDRVHLLDAGGQIDAEPLAERVGRPVKTCSLVETAGIAPDDVAACSSEVDFALAYGAALTLSEKEKGVNFRDDHMPYLGTKLRMDRALKFVSISVTILLLAVGVYFHSHLLRVNQTRVAVREKFEPDYLAVMLGKTKLPPAIKTAVTDLERTRRLIMSDKGIGGAAQESVSAKLTLILQALNSCAARTDLKIETITITGKNIHVNGDTSSRSNTNAVFEAMEKAGLKVQDNRVGQKSDRDCFDVTVEPKKQSERS